MATRAVSAPFSRGPSQREMMITRWVGSDDIAEGVY